MTINCQNGRVVYSETINGVYDNGYDCPKSVKNQYLIQEKVPGMTLYSKIESSIVNKNWKWVPYFLLQMGLSLTKAYELYDYTHYDLHNLNVLIHEYSGDITTKYDRYKLKSKHMSFIIDYSDNHVKYEGKHYGSPEYLQGNIFPDKSFPLFDILKILLWFVKAYFLIRVSQGFNMHEYEKIPDEVENIIFYIRTILNQYLHGSFNYSTIKEKIDFRRKFVSDSSSFGRYELGSKFHDFLDEYYGINIHAVKLFPKLLRYRYSHFLSYFEEKYKNLLIFPSVTGKL